MAPRPYNGWEVIAETLPSVDVSPDSHNVPYKASMTARCSPLSIVDSWRKPSVSSLGLVVLRHCCHVFHDMALGFSTMPAWIHSSKVLPAESAIAFVTSYLYLPVVLPVLAVCAGFNSAIVVTVGIRFPGAAPN